VCAHVCEAVCTSKWSGVEDLVAHMSRCQDPETATGQMMCLSPAAGGINFVHTCILVYIPTSRPPSCLARERNRKKLLVFM